MDPAITEQVLTRYARGDSLDRIRDDLGLTFYCVRKIVRDAGVLRDRNGRSPAAQSGHVAPEFPGLKEYPPDPTELLDFLETAAEQHQKWDTAQREVPVVIATDQPIAVAFRGDWHAGNKNTLYKLLRRDNAIIRDTAGLYTAELGDFCDAFIKPTMQDGAQEALVPVKIQRHYVWASYREYLQGKVLGDVTGQHDHWASQMAAFDPVEWLSHDFKIPYLRHGGTIHLQVGEQQYEIAVRHKARGTSQWNPTHSNIRTLYFDRHYDVVAHADKHIFGIQEVEHEGKHSILVRPGSYKPYDNFSDSHDFGESQPTIPVIIFWPDRHEMQCIRGIEVAADIVSRLRDGGRP